MTDGHDDPRTFGDVFSSVAVSLKHEKSLGMATPSQEQLSRIKAVIDAVSPASSNPTIASLKARGRAEAAQQTMQEPASMTPPASANPVAAPLHTTSQHQEDAARAVLSAPSARSPQNLGTMHKKKAPTSEAQEPSAHVPNLPWMKDADTTAREIEQLMQRQDAPADAPTYASNQSNTGVSKASAMQSLQEKTLATPPAYATSDQKPMWGSGPLDAALMLIGEAPSAADETSGNVFQDDAGELLENMLSAMGLKRQDVYMTNLLKFRTPHNRPPTQEESALATRLLQEEITIVQPQVILTLGTVASHQLLPDGFDFGQHRGQWHKMNGVRIMPTWHPAHLLVQPEYKRSAWQDLQEVMKVLGLKRG